MDYDIRRVIDLDKWEALQDTLAKTTKLAIILVDYKGKPVSKHSRIQPFCQLVRSDETLSKHCETCDARGALEAVRQEAPYIYRCHVELVDVAIPIMIDSHYVGAIMAGQIRLESGDASLESILTLKETDALSRFIETHLTEYQHYPTLSCEELNQSIELLTHLSDYIVSEAIKKDYYVEAYKQALHLTSAHHNVLNDMEIVQKELNETMLNSRIDATYSHYIAKNKQLQPAIDLIFANKSTTLSLNQLADVVHLSPSYVSRLLKEEFGQSFSHMYRQLKVNWAKQVLLETDDTISSISDALGYVEPSYFIRQFKKHVGTTPLKYRQCIKKERHTKSV